MNSSFITFIVLCTMDNKYVNSNVSKSNKYCTYNISLLSHFKHVFIEAPDHFLYGSNLRSLSSLWHSRKHARQKRSPVSTHLTTASSLQRTHHGSSSGGASTIDLLR